MTRRRIGILGYGKVGQYLAQHILKDEDLQLVFVWNRTTDKMKDVPAELRITHLTDALERDVDLIVEVAHPVITENYGCRFLEKCDYFIGSPTALAAEGTWKNLQRASFDYKHTVYVSSGAFWGGEDIRKMADTGTLRAVTVTMTKHPTSFRLESPLKEVNQTVLGEPLALYDGPVRQLCALAPNNVNTMAAACIAAHNLGFDGVQGVLVSDPSCLDFHIITIEVEGDNGFSVRTVRKNPAPRGAVSGLATYAAFFASIKSAYDKTNLGPLPRALLSKFLSVFLFFCSFS